QDLLISGACFILPSFGPGAACIGASTVTSVFGGEVGNAKNVIQACRLTGLNANLVDAFFNFGTDHRGKTFLILLRLPNATSQDLTTAVNGCLGNQQGVQVSFTCDAAPAPPPPTQTIDIAIVSGCSLSRLDSGVFNLTVTGKNIKDNATITVGGVT